MDSGIIHEFADVVQDLREGKDEEVYMTGQFYSTAFIASFILVLATISAYLVYKNSPIRFSFEIIVLIILSSIGTLLF